MALPWLLVEYRRSNSNPLGAALRDKLTVLLAFKVLQLSAVVEVRASCLLSSNDWRGAFPTMMLGAFSSESKVASVGDSFKSCAFEAIQK